MKTPLRYQITEFDCGTVSLTNCISYLFEREEIPAELIRNINVYTLDCYDEKGNIGQGGTSRQAVNFLSQWIEGYCKQYNHNLNAKYLSKSEVDLDKIKKCVKSGGCANLRTYLGSEHYVLVTDVDNDYVYIFDPYYLEKHSSNEVIIVNDFPTKYNRKIKIDRFLRTGRRVDFALGPIERRMCFIHKKTLNT